MDTKGNTGRIGTGKIYSFVIPEGEDELHELQNVRGVHLQGGVWLCDMCFRGKRKRVSCGTGLDGYRKAVKMRADFEQSKRKRQVKDMFE